MRASLGRVSILVKVCEVATVRCVEAESPTVLQTRHPSEAPQEIFSVGLTNRVIAGAANWGPDDVTTEDHMNKENDCLTLFRIENQNKFL